MTNYENYIVAVENEYMSREAIIGLLHNSPESFTHLLEKNYIKSEQGNAFALCFVGTIVFKDKVICVLPKYYKWAACSYDQQISEFATVLKVLKKTGRINEIPDSNNFSSDEYVNLTEIVLADKFLKDYLEYGIYNKTNSSLVLNGDGETNWDISINGLHPLFTGGRPVYTDVYTSSSITEQYNVITELHKWVIKYCLQRFGRISDYKFSFAEDAVSEISHLGSAEYVRASIRSALDITYTDREILLLKRLIAFLDKMQEDAADGFSLYGTGYFHVIWELVCGAVLNNRINDFIHLMPSPLWNDNNGRSVAKETLRPDIICTIEGEESRFFIFDAKYYNLRYIEEGDLTVSGNPGIQDVSKQFLYLRAFRDVPYGRKYNCFIFPEIGTDFFRVAGSITFALFDGARIYNIFASPDMLFKAYLTHDIRNEELIKRFLTGLGSISNT